MNLGKLSRDDSTFRLQSSFKPPDAVIPKQAYITLMPYNELCFIMLTAIRDGLACFKKVQKVSRNPGCHNMMFQIRTYQARRMEDILDRRLVFSDVFREGQSWISSQRFSEN